jgi:hypothetical protein
MPFSEGTRHSFPARSLSRARCTKQTHHANRDIVPIIIDIQHSHVGSPVAFRKVFQTLRPWYRRFGEQPIVAPRLTSRSFNVYLGLASQAIAHRRSAAGRSDVKMPPIRQIGNLISDEFLGNSPLPLSIAKQTAACQGEY